MPSCVFQGEATLSCELSACLHSNCVQEMGLNASNEPSASAVASSASLFVLMVACGSAESGRS